MTILAEFPTIADLQQAYGARRLSPLELIRTLLQQVDALNETLHAFLTVSHETALAAASHAEEQLAAGGDLPPLFGVPIAVKDAEATSGIRTTYGSHVYEQYVPMENTIHVQRLLDAGAIIIGKTNTPEFTLLSETINLLGPDCRNPADHSRTTGGSSGGSAAAVAAGLVPLASGTDTAGSITIPAAFCGVFGLKPSHRRNPVWPNWDDWPQLYNVGPISNCVADAALALRITAGFDSRDPYAMRSAVPDYAAALDQPLGKLRIAWTPSFDGHPVDPDCRDAVVELADAFARLGHQVTCAAPDVGPAGTIAEDIGFVEEYRVRGHLLEQADLLHPKTAEMLRTGRVFPADRYATALINKQRLTHQFNQFFDDFDLLLAPASATPAFPLRHPPDCIDGRKVQADCTGFTPFNMYGSLTGSPVATVPAGKSGHLPVGVLIFGPYGADSLVLQAAEASRRAGCWIERPLKA